ncbi:ABC transporter permease [Streptomyces sp. NPDC051572]|uniref:ABC transporter permease n=1 Tax=unclassified Streptomyces TaxID=2593676 RepID=UPI00344B66DC
MTVIWRRNRWWISRVAVLPVHLFLFSIVVFFLVRLIPGDPVSTLTAGQPVTPEQVEKARQSLGLSGSLWEQLTTYLGHVVTLDFGSSMITGVPVGSDLAQRIPETIELAAIAMGGCLLVTVSASLFVLLRPGTIVAKALTQYARTAGAVPDFVLGVAAIYVFYAVLHWAPAPLGLYDSLMQGPPRITSFPLLDAILSGRGDLMASMAGHLVLPELVLIVTHTPFLMKLFVRAVQDSCDAPATRFRIATGASRLMVLTSIIRRSSPSAIAMFGTMFGTLLGGAVVIEQLFSLPGLGTFGINAVNTADLVSLQAFLLLIAAMSLTVFLLVDIVNMLVDPRRRPGTTEGAVS